MARLIDKLKLFAAGGQSIINGVFGDKIEHTSLGIIMGFYLKNKPIILDKKAMLEYTGGVQEKITSKICILIHGLTNNESTWSFKDKSDYGLMLSRELSFTPFYVRYNTGLHISDNGKNLSDIIETLCKNYPVPIDEISIIAHSMGGLVTHSACHLAKTQDLFWTKKLRNVFLLATPHLGSFLEQFANITTNILDKIPNWPTRMVGRAINMRSAGIKDLRFGYITEEDWKNKQPDSLLSNTKKPVSKLEGVNYFVIYGILPRKEKHWLGNVFGDVLVTAKSATGRSYDNSGFNFREEHHFEFPKTNHATFTSNQAVYKKILELLSE
ncbi:MAG: hypothetical protein IPO92_02105 [Saprospiraceae bacterium]|nr:hypothetical protein [Saprospiraceae bacterium]